MTAKTGAKGKMDLKIVEFSWTCEGVTGVVRGEVMLKLGNWLDTYAKAMEMATIRVIIPTIITAINP